MWLANFSSNFCLLTGEAGIVNVQGCGMRWYLSWQAQIRRHRARSYLQSFWKFEEISRKVSILIYLYRWAENQIFLKIVFSKTLMFTGFFVFFHYSNVYKLFECMLLVFDFIANWYLKKQRNLHKFFQNRVSDIFKWTFWQTSFHQVLYSNKEVLYPRSFMSSKASLLTSIPKNVSPWLWL